MLRRSIHMVLAIMIAAGTTCTQPAGKRSGATVLLWAREHQRLDSLLKKLPDDFARTSFLRTYCAALLDVGRLDENTATVYRSQTYTSFRLEHFYPLFLKDSIAADCGISSYFFIKLAQSFGFNSYQYSFGFRDVPYTRYVHSFPLVEITVRGEKRLIVQDPYLNLTFMDRAGEPIDFHQMLLNVKQGNYEKQARVSPVVLTNLLVGDTLQYWPYLEDSCRQLMRKLIIRPDGTVLHKIPLERDYKTMMQSPCNSFEQGFLSAMRAHGFLQPFLYAYTLRVADMVGSTGVDTVQAGIDLILHNTIPD